MSKQSASVDAVVESVLSDPRFAECLERLEAHWPKPRIKSPDLVFQRLGRFEIRRELGRGRFGVVFLAWDPQIQRQVALKVPQFDAAMDPDLRERFRGEALSAGKLQHSGIVSIYDVGQHAGVDYLAMAYVEGGTLADRLKTGPLPPRDAVRLVMKLAEAVHHAHEQGVIHRDLKPSNVLLDQQDQPRVTDFGLARRLSESAMRATATGQVLGTPAYMPPEQAVGKSDIGPASDVYSLGVILYESLTGRPPFQAASFAEAVEFILNREPLPPSKLIPKLPRELDAITFKCLEKNAAARYASAADLADDLQRFLNGQPIRARTPGYLEHAWRWARRYPSQALLLVATLVAIVLLLATSTVYTRWKHADELAAKERENAATQRYFATVTRARNIIARRNPGWTKAAAGELRAAAASNIPVADPIELRMLATECLTGFDLHAAGAIKTGMLIGRIASSPNGELLAVGELKGSLLCRVLVYEVSSRKLLHTFRVLNLRSSIDRLSGGEAKWQEGVREFAFSTDSRYLAVGMRFGSIYCYDLQAPEKAPQRLIVSNNRELAKIAFSNDGQTVFALTKDDQFLQWKNWPANAREEAPPNLHPRSFAVATQGPSLFLQQYAEGFRMLNHRLEARTHYSPLADLPESQEADFVTDATGALLAGESKHGLRVYETLGGYLARRLQDDSVADESLASELFMSADGQVLAAHDGYGVVRIYDVARGRQVLRLDLPRYDFQDVAFDPQRRWLAVANDYNIDLWNLTSPQIRKVVNSPSETVEDMQFSPRGDALACISTAGALHAPFRSTLAIFATQTGAPIDKRNYGWEHLGWHPPMSQVMWSADGRQVIASGVIGTTAWQVSPAGRLSSPRPLPLLGVQTPLDFVVSAVKPNKGDPAIVEQIPHPAFKDRLVWAITPRQQTVRVKARLRQPLQTANQVPAVVLSVCIDGDHSYSAPLTLRAAIPDQKAEPHRAPPWLLASAGQFQLWSFQLPRAITEWTELELEIDAAPEVRSFQIERIDFATLTLTTKPPFKPTTQPIQFLNSSPDGDRIWGCVEEEIVSWRWPEGERLTGWEYSTHQLTRAANIRSLDAGKNGALVGTRDGRIHWLDAKKGTPQRAWAGPGTEVVSAVLCDQAPMAIIGAENGKVRGLALPEGKILFDLDADDSAIIALAATPDGTLLITASANRTLKLWKPIRADVAHGYTLAARLPDTLTPTEALEITADGKYLAILGQSTSCVDLWDLPALRGELARLGIE